ncbi:MAG: prepilin peptidase [Endozoicomonadaceae bacterium]|nr:prepilin peptidase [Endozoicomonadaceae bacterium]
MLLLVFILGLIIGSFLNVVIYRLPLSVKGENFSIIEPKHSICPNCQTSLGFLQLIPLLSFIMQRGKCKHCEVRISWQYPVVELLCGMITLWAVTQFGIGFEAMFYLLFIYISIALFMIDFKHQLLPDVLTLGLLYLGLLFHLDNYVALSQGVIGAVVGYLSLWSIYWLFKLITGKEGLGYGDFKLTAALGAWLGWVTLPVLISLSATLALIFAVFKGIKYTQAFSFGPFLLLAGAGLLFMNKIT